jgi:hypothetical protein
MKLIVLAVAFLLVTSGGHASETPKHLLLGVWSLDLARVSQPGPRSVTITLRESDGGAYRMAVHIEAPDGTHMKSEGEFTPGGGTVLVQGSADVDVVTFTMPSRRILVMAGAYQGRPSHTRVWALTDDGKEMTETIVGHIDGKTPHIRTNYWVRK